MFPDACCRRTNRGPIYLNQDRSRGGIWRVLWQVGYRRAMPTTNGPPGTNHASSSVRVPMYGRPGWRGRARTMCSSLVSRETPSIVRTFVPICWRWRWPCRCPGGCGPACWIMLPSRALADLISRSPMTSGFSLRSVARAMWTSSIIARRAHAHTHCQPCQTRRCQTAGQGRETRGRVDGGRDVSSRLWRGMGGKLGVRRQGPDSLLVTTPGAGVAYLPTLTLTIVVLVL